MATIIYCDDFSEQIAKAIHNFGTHTFKLAFSNTAPIAANAVLADITQIAYTNSDGPLTVTITASEASGTMTIGGDTVTLTASGGSVATFRYYTLYNDTATNDNIVCSWDHGSAVTLANGETFKVSFNNDDTAGTILTIAHP
jgi:hypothetical protein